MPSQVVVVKRSRRRAFGLLRGLPAWLRALWMVSRRVRRRAGESREASSTPNRGVWPGTGPMRPLLRFDGQGAHACTACGRCIPICPSRCLTLEAGEGNDGEGRRLERLALVDAACIGCGLCVEVCPEEALAMTLRGSQERVRVGRGDRTTDLLQAGA